MLNNEMSENNNITDGVVGGSRASEETPVVSREMAHELSNLLDGSLRNLSLAMSSLGGDGGGGGDGELSDAVLRQLETASEGMTHMVRLLRGWMRDGGKGMGGLSELLGEASTVRDAVNYAMRLAGPLAEERGVEIGYAVSSEAEGLVAGPVYQVLSNGLGNAIEAVGEGGLVRVGVEVEGDEVVLTVSDNGPGMLAEIPRDDYGFFERGKTTKVNGNGLGLWVCREVIENLGGVMRLEDGPHGGVTLMARWPIAATGVESLGLTSRESEGV
ncbi:MAG: sensor histidine kinase [Planctomycetota bacterium]|jgi:signal transduction histidine kinase